MPISPTEIQSQFPTTVWTLVLQAGNPDSESYRDALSAVCASYWGPVYAFIRRKGYGAEQAADYTQGFFARVIEREYLADVERSKGRFRSFLLAAVTHFVSNQLDAERALKRGGGY